MTGKDRSPGSSGDLDDSFDDSIPYSTPVTSPETSPIKRPAKSCFETPLQIHPRQLGDGFDDNSLEDGDESDKDKERVDEPPSSSFEDDDQDSRNDVKGHTANDTTTDEIDDAEPSLYSTPPFSLSLRHRRLIHRADNSDRFIPARQQAPTKERLALSRPAARSSMSGLGYADVDPFASPAQHSLRLNQVFTVTRYPEPPIRPHGLATTIVQRDEQIIRRNPELAASWSVGGVPVTEGITSSSNGRGGRITSGTTAPLYNADVLTVSHISDKLAVLSDRLALAMGLDEHGRIIKVDRGLTAAVRAPRLVEDIISSGQKTVWKECRWQTTRSPLAPVSSEKKPKRLPRLPYKVLDAPDLRNDYYCSLLAYSPTLRCLAVGLANNVHIWYDRRVGRVDGVCDSLKLADDDGHVTTLSFSSRSGGKSILAIGCADGRLTLWSPLEERPRLRCDQPTPISHVSFRPCTARRASERDPNVTVDTEELLVGTEIGKVLLYSVEWPDKDQCDLFDWSRSMMLRTIITCNEQQICGIAWSRHGELFATGGNDNQLFVFDFDKVHNNALSTIRDAFGRARRARAATPGAHYEHPVIMPGGEKQLFTLNAAVKAIAFAPWQASLLAASGGSNDRCIHFWNTTYGAKLATINCHAQVTSLVWNEHRKEIAATLGFAQPDHAYRVVVFAWPSCKQLARIPWAGEERALYGISYPGVPLQRQQRDCIVIATSDHSIKFHEVWPESKNGGKQAANYAKSQILNDMCSEVLENEMQIR